MAELRCLGRRGCKRSAIDAIDRCHRSAELWQYPWQYPGKGVAGGVAIVAIDLFGFLPEGLEQPP
jgi:hypothetical protein